VFSSLEVNLPSKIKSLCSNRELFQGINGSNPASIVPLDDQVAASVFDEAFDEVLKLMYSDTFPRFRRVKENKELWERFLTTEAQGKILTQTVKETSLGVTSDNTSAS
jgi:hypothetical protein